MWTIYFSHIQTQQQHSTQTTASTKVKLKKVINNALICFNVSHIKHFLMTEPSIHESHNHKIKPTCLLGALSPDTFIRSVSFENWRLIPCALPLKLFRRWVWPCFLICFSDSPDNIKPWGHVTQAQNKSD